MSRSPWAFPFVCVSAEGFAGAGAWRRKGGRIDVEVGVLTLTCFAHSPRHVVASCLGDYVGVRAAFLVPTEAQSQDSLHNVWT